MSLENITLKEEYRTGYDNLAEDFYKPCLSVASKYSRSVGYFSSSVFLLIGPEFVRFAQRNGRARLICSPFLSNGDIEALQHGYSAIVDKDSAGMLTLKSVDLLLSDNHIIKNTQALATLIMVGALEVKIAFRKNGSGIYHEKIGIIDQGSHASVTFKGSVNETWNGWHDNGNFESLDVFCSWKGGRDQRQVERNKQYFERLWNNEIADLEIIAFPQVAKDRLATIAKSSVAELEPDDLNDYFANSYVSNYANNYASNYANTQAKTNMAKTPAKPKRQPLPHQLQAIAAWIAQGKQGILEHATGSGKTFTALIALKAHLNQGGVALVLVPARLLHQQWADEIKQEIPAAIILKAGDGHNGWRANRRLQRFTQPVAGAEPRIVLATMATARLDEFTQNIGQGEHLMVVADEVHEIGSRENAKALSILAGSRLGLSATPYRYGDPLGTDKILNYFGAVLAPPFTLLDAINCGRLVKYEYHPYPLHLTVAEAQDWELATRKISQEYARAKQDSDGKPIISPQLQIMLIQRARIAKKAAAKVPCALSIVREHYIKGQSWLIYCEDQYQLGEVMTILGENGYQPCEYHTNMTGDASAALAWFKQFGGIMVSIRCLDQGIDIPKISHAVILASSQNPRQFIQRRGRVLRSCPDKYLAVIFDAVVVPVCLEQEPGQLSLLKSELQRCIQFSQTAINRAGAHTLSKIAIELGIDPTEMGLMTTAGIEESGETEDE